MKKQNYYETPKSNWLMRYLWKAAGADSYILEKSTYADHVKYACLGGIVLATGFMAAMAGGYAFYIIFEPRGEAIKSTVDTMNNTMGIVSDTISNTIDSASNKQIASTNNDATHVPTAIMSIVFGFIWGLIIFNIDRFIVASTGKGDGTEAITWGEIKSAVPRILMGMIIAITISKPVEIRMFKTEIDVRLHEKQMDEYDKTQKKAYAKHEPKINNIEVKISDVESKIKSLKDEITKKEDEYAIAKDALNIEMSNPVRRGIGPIAMKLDEEVKRVDAQLATLKKENNRKENDLRKKITKLEEDRSEVEMQLEKDKNKAEGVANSLNGLLERLKIAHEIAGIWITLFITLLFMAIELTPIFFKMMLIKSPYDFMSDNIKSLIQAEQGIEIKYDFYKDKQGLQRDLVINHQAERLMKEKIKLIQTQNELSEIVMENWKNKELKNIKEDPESYIDKKS